MAAKYINIVLIVVLFLTSFKTLYAMYVGDPIIIHPLPHVVISIGWAMEVLGVLLKKETDSKTNKGEF